MKKGNGVLLVVMLLVVGDAAQAADAGRPGAAGMERFRVETLNRMSADLRKQLQARLRHDLDVVMMDSRHVEWTDRSGTARSGASWSRSAP